RRDAHLLGAAPRDRAHIAVDDLHRRDRVLGRLLDRGEGERELEAEEAPRIDEALAVLLQREDLAAIDPFPLEDAACIMKGVRQHMDLRIAPRRQRAVEPDEAVAVVERYEGHGEGSLLR